MVSIQLVLSARNISEIAALKRKYATGAWGRKTSEFGADFNWCLVRGTCNWRSARTACNEYLVWGKASNVWHRMVGSTGWITFQELFKKLLCGFKRRQKSNYGVNPFKEIILIRLTCAVRVSYLDQSQVSIAKVAPLWPIYCIHNQLLQQYNGDL